MNSFKFTESQLKKLPIPENGRVLYYDMSVPELGLTVTSSGNKSFHVKGRVNGKTVRPSIPNGRFPQIHPDQARKIARSMLVEMATGSNPIEAKREAVIEEARIKAEAAYIEVTLNHALTEFLASKRLTHKPTTQKNYRRFIENKLDFGNFLNKPLREITLDEILKVHKSRGQKSNQAIKSLKTIFNYALHAYEHNGQPVFTNNPVLKYESMGIKQRYTKRTGMIEGENLEGWFKAVETMNDRKDREYILFLLFTGSRGGEIHEKLTWDKIDFTTHTYSLDDTKNRLDVELPLPGYIEDMIVTRNNDTGTNGKVFPQVYDDGQKILKYLSDKTGENFTRHDLRRTYTTIAEACEIPHSVIKQLLNHRRSSSNGDITDDYKQFQKVSAYREDKVDPVLAATRTIESTILRVANRQKGEVVAFSTVK